MTFSKHLTLHLHFPPPSPPVFLWVPLFSFLLLFLFSSFMLLVTLLSLLSSHLLPLLSVVLSLLLPSSPLPFLHPPTLSLPHTTAFAHTHTFYSPRPRLWVPVRLHATGFSVVYLRSYLRVSALWCVCALTRQRRFTVGL